MRKIFTQIASIETTVPLINELNYYVLKLQKKKIVKLIIIWTE